jgi:hypothetical protein
MVALVDDADYDRVNALRHMRALLDDAQADPLLDALRPA